MNPYSYVLAFANPPNDPTVQAQINGTLLHFARRPDAGSDFDLNTRHLRHLPDEHMLPALREMGYNSVVAIGGNKVVGLTGFQVHDRKWHGFVHHVPQELEGSGIGKGLIQAFLSFAMKTGAEAVILWGEDKKGKLSPVNRAKMEGFYRRIMRNDIGIDFPVTAGQLPGEIVLHA